MKLVRSTVMTLALAAGAFPAAAQVKKLEITPTVGYRFGGTTSSYSNSYIERFKIEDSASAGLTVEYAVHPRATVELLWSHHDTVLGVDLRAGAPTGQNPPRTHLLIDTIQIGGLWQSGSADSPVRGYFDLLFGVSILTPAPQYSGLSRFSASVGGGAKFRISESIGVRAGLRWMPVYINSSGTGYGYCDPYWGCYEYYNNNYLYQTDAHLGLIFKF